MGEAEELRVCSRWAPMIDKPEIITGENWISPENNRMRMLMSFSAYIWLAKTNVLSLLPSHFHLSVTLLLFPSPSPGLCPVFLLLDFSHLLPASLISFFFLSPLMFPSIPQRASAIYPHPLATIVLSLVHVLLAEAEDHDYLCGGEEVSA